MAREEEDGGPVERSPNPTELEAKVSEELVEQHRNLYCFHYDRCLDLAVKSGWESWTCSRCALMQERVPAPGPSNFAFSRTKEGGFSE